MIKKIIFLIFIIFIFNINLFSDEVIKSENEKAFDISIGGCLTPLYQLKFLSARRIDDEKGIDQLYSNFDHRGFGIGASFVFSFSYFYKLNTSIGFTFLTGYLFNPYFSSLNIFNNTVSSKILFRLKRGNPNKNIRFLFETGILANVEIPFYPNGNIERILTYDEYDNYTEGSYSDIIYPDLYFSIGPIFSFGFESRYKNYSFELSAFFGGTFGTTFSESFQNVIGPNINFNIIPIGIDIKWNYYKYKVIN